MSLTRVSASVAGADSTQGFEWPRSGLGGARFRQWRDPMRHFHCALAQREWRRNKWPRDACIH